MKHVIRIAAACLDLPPLAAVAAAMARSAATAGGTEFHKPTFDGRMSAYERRLVTDAKAGRLIVSDQFGGMGTVDEIVQRSRDDGVYSEVFAHVGGQVDQQKTLSLILHASLQQLNAWGASSGDSFVIDSSGIEWIDERGLVTPAAQPEAPPATQRQAAPAESTPKRLCHDVQDAVERICAYKKHDGTCIDRWNMPGTASDLLWAMGKLHPEKFESMHMNAFRRHYKGICKWPRAAASQTRVKSLYLEIFPELKRNPVSVVQINK